MKQIKRLKERLDRAKRAQARMLAGVRATAPSMVAAPAADTQHDGVSVARRPFDTPFDRAGLMAEFEDLLPVIARHYGFSNADIEFTRAAVSAQSSHGYADLVLCVRQWRLDAVTHGLLAQLPEGVAQRAWVQFRLSIMRERADEAGEAYRGESLMRPLEAAGRESRAGSAAKSPDNEPDDFLGQFFEG